ncbi:flavin reductase family protein [Cellulomonas sp. SLBN-39]|uniref:flavin reductase family protein n=1 Tax=Cellulomonas sp. SLBN-39 TaxID=2768446 RepID=UPI00114E9566|nr:flavin reductase family protein [Cellulomonas sp. SLBN-39]TQL02799.1 flavin reductase ActVB [Cellulomonas sp. SLBN-39]
MTLLQPAPAVRRTTTLTEQPRAFRDGLSAMVTSVCVITTAVDGHRHGFTANSVTSVSMDPPLVLVCLADTAECHDAFWATDCVAVNVLADDQAHLSTVFATRGADKFAAATFHAGATGAPVLEGATLTLEGRVHERTTAGDHTMILVEVTAVAQGDRTPLTYQGRRFRRLLPTEE